MLNHPNLSISVLGGYLVLTVKGKGAISSVQVPQSRLEMLDFADTLQDAATNIRSALALEDPAEAFKLAQALQFGTDRLEGDL